MDCITPALSEAIDDLTKYNEWGAKDDHLEDVLSSHDWRLAEIKAFRSRMNMAQENHELRAKEAITDELTKKGIIAKKEQALYLARLGMGYKKIADVLRVSVTTAIKWTGSIHQTGKGIGTFKEFLVLVRSQDCVK